MAGPSNFKGPGPGRPKGMLNANTKAIKDMILGALEDAGGQAYLARQAEENPGPFMTLVGKCLPKDINANVEGGLSITSITRTIIDPKNDTGT